MAPARPLPVTAKVRRLRLATAGLLLARLLPIPAASRSRVAARAVATARVEFRAGRALVEVRRFTIDDDLHLALVPAHG